MPTVLSAPTTSAGPSRPIVTNESNWQSGLTCTGVVGRPSQLETEQT